MKTIEINFREPNIDRFVEIYAVSVKFGFNFRISIKNMPKGYRKFLEILFAEDGEDIRWPDSEIELSDFAVEYPENVYFDRLFVKYEPIEEIKNRIYSCEEIENPKIDESGLQILEVSAKRLNINKDDIQNILSLSCVIAAMDGEKKQVKAHHVAEAIQYVYLKYEQNEQ